MGTAFRAGEGVDFINDDRVDGGEDRCGFGRQHEIERLGGGDQNVWGFSHLAVALRLRGVARAHSDRDVGDVTPHPPGNPGNTGQRGAEVVFHIDPQGLQW